MRPPPGPQMFPPPPPPNTHIPSSFAVAEQLGIFLYRVGRRSNFVWDISEQFGISQWAVEAATRRVSLAIMDVFSDRVCMPQDEAERSAIGVDFSTSRGRPSRDPFAFDGACGAIDVVHVLIVPDSRSVGDAVSSVFANRKSHLSVCFQAIARADGSFLHFSGAYVGSQVDQATLYGSRVWAERDAHLDLARGRFWLADGGYALTPYTICPYDKVDIALRRPQGQLQLRQYNMISSSKRSAVENGFGKWKARFSLLGSVVWFRDMAMYSLVPRACAVLHNCAVQLAAPLARAPLHRSPLTPRRAHARPPPNSVY